MLILLLSSAHAQDVATGGEIPAGLNSQVFRPSVDAQRTLWTDDTLMADNGTTTGRALLSYTSDPLVYINCLDARTELVSSLYQLNLLGAHTRGPIRIGLDVPLYLRAIGEASGSESGLGDVAASVRYTALDRRTAAAVRPSDPARRWAAAIRSSLILAYSGLIWLDLAPFGFILA